MQTKIQFLFRIIKNNNYFCPANLLRTNLNNAKNYTFFFIFIFILVNDGAGKA